MRYLLYDSNEEQVELQAEVDFLRDYIALQSLRLKDSNVLNITIPNVVPPMFISPMILIPFVENAFKYLSQSSASRQLKISIVLKGNILEMETSNTFDSVLPKKQKNLWGELD